jgi:molybdopterin/thiamine biosynthesis adenylyltransferase
VLFAHAQPPDGAPANEHCAGLRGLIEGNALYNLMHLQAIRKVTVVVVGVGGVGSVAADMLVRCGVGKVLSAWVAIRR